MQTNTPLKNTIKITIDITRPAAELLSQEARENKRSRKGQLEIALEKHAERYARLRPVPEQEAYDKPME